MILAMLYSMKMAVAAGRLPPSTAATEVTVQLVSTARLMMMETEDKALHGRQSGAADCDGCQHARHMPTDMFFRKTLSSPCGLDGGLEAELASRDRFMIWACCRMGCTKR